MAKKILVVLDPGHYPNYNKGVDSGYYEGNKMYTLTEYEKNALEEYDGIDVIITRKKNKDMELYSRGQVAVKNAKGYDVVIFISNHTNAHNGNAYGVEAYRSVHLPESVKLGNKLIDAIVGVMKPTTGITYDRGVKTRKLNSGADYYGVIRGAVSNAKNEAQAKKNPVDFVFIIEHGFHDNKTECKFLNKDANLKKIAEAKAEVIADYFGLEKIKKEEPVKKPPVKKPTVKVKKAYSGTFPTLPKKGYLGKGDTGTQVGRLQAFLNWYGGYGLVVDNSFGSLTLSAVKKFQKATGLEVDGYFGSKSLAKAKTIKK